MFFIKNGGKTLHWTIRNMTKLNQLLYLQDAVESELEYSYPIFNTTLLVSITSGIFLVFNESVNENRIICRSVLLVKRNKLKKIQKPANG